VRDIPILIGGGGEKVTLRLTAEHADIWHYFWSARNPGEYIRKSGILDEWCAKVGRNAASIIRSAGVDPKKVDQGDALLEAGVGEITLGFTGPDFDLAPVAEWLAWRDRI
jgi:alkanesulfonate monooxygenase SsuD/methylene tetrahydromethanopterin reductase-like flavin-dependent oxidoreductase (luciferase family)